MDNFLIKSDFYGTYPEEAFNKLINDDDSIWENKLTDTIEEISSYLRARYDVALIFADMLLFDVATAFVIGDWIYWTEALYSETATYLTGERVTFVTGTKTYIYEANQNVSTPEAFDPAKWTLLALDESKYKCIADSTGNLPNDTDFFTAGDPRNGKIVEITIDIVLYNLLNRLNNIDIPVNRKERYDGNDAKQTGGAIGYLKLINKGQIQPDLPLIEENQEDQTGNIVIASGNTDVQTKNYVF